VFSFYLLFFLVTDHQTDYLSNIYGCFLSKRKSICFLCVLFTQRFIFIYLTMMTQLISQDFLSTAVHNTVIGFPSIKKQKQKRKERRRRHVFLRCIHHRHFKRKRLYRRMKSRGRALSKHENQTDIFHESHRVFLQ